MVGKHEFVDKSKFSEISEKALQKFEFAKQTFLDYIAKGSQEKTTILSPVTHLVPKIWRKFRAFVKSHKFRARRREATEDERLVTKLLPKIGPVYFISVEPSDWAKKKRLKKTSEALDLECAKEQLVLATDKISPISMISFSSTPLSDFHFSDIDISIAELAPGQENREPNKNHHTDFCIPMKNTMKRKRILKTATACRTIKKTKTSENSSESEVSSLSSPFMTFCSRLRSTICEQNQSFSPKQVSRILVETWRRMSPELKNTFKSESEGEKRDSPRFVFTLPSK